MGYFFLSHKKDQTEGGPRFFFAKDHTFSVFSGTLPLVEILANRSKLGEIGIKLRARIPGKEGKEKIIMKSKIKQASSGLCKGSFGLKVSKTFS